jgi:hypothetical protein
MWELFVNRSLSVSSLCSSSLCNGASKHHRSNGPSQDRRIVRNFGSTTNRVRGWENSVFSFQFSVFSFQGAVFRVQDLEISSYSCDSFYSWFKIFAFFDKDVIHESNAVFHGLA